jgi:effector-binding domain-containing protein
MVTMLEKVAVPATPPQIRRTTCTHGDLGPTIGRLFSEIVAGNPDAELEDAPRVYYREWKPDVCEIEVALPVSGGTGPAEGTSLKVYPACVAVMSVHHGPYDQLHEAWMKFYAQVQQAGLQPSGYPWDSYAVGAMDEPDPANWVTELYLPVA